MIKFLEGGIGVNLCNFELGSGFLNTSLKHKQKKKKSTSPKLKPFLYQQSLSRK